MNRRDPESADELVRGGGRAVERPAALEVVKEWVRSAVVDNASLKVVALFLSLTMFILVQSDEDEIVPVSVSVSYAAPRPGLTLVDEPPSTVRVSIRGSRRRLKRLKESELDPIQVTLTNTGEFVIQPAMVRPLPEGLEVASISPPSISLRYESTDDKPVSIRARTTGSPASGYRIESITTSPESLEVRGAESALARTVELSTQPLSIDGATETVTGQVALAVPPFPVQVVVNDGLENPVSVMVNVTVEIAPTQFRIESGDRRIAIMPDSGVPVTALNDWTVEPSTARLVLRGEESAVKEKLDVGALRVGVRLNMADVIAKTARTAEVIVLDVPEGVAVEKTPRQVRLIPK